MQRFTLVLFATSIALAAGCSRDSADKPTRTLPPDQAAALLEDRNWMDHWPTNESEKLHVYRFTPAMGGGVYQDRTLFAGHFELFTYQVDGEHLTIQWPHSSEEDRMVFTVERVDGPEPFDLRLELTNSSRGPRSYFGRSAETSTSSNAFALPSLDPR